MVIKLLAFYATGVYAVRFVVDELHGHSSETAH